MRVRVLLLLNVDSVVDAAAAAAAAAALTSATAPTEGCGIRSPSSQQQTAFAAPADVP